MPTPIGHALAGLAVAGVAGAATRQSNQRVGVLIFCATAPDLDLMLRFVDGVNHHRGASHSVTAALIAGIAAAVLRRFGAEWLPGAVAVGAAWGSHVALDYLGLDTSPPIGEMALWPLSSDFFASPVALFYDVPRSFTPEAIRHNLVALAIELVILTPVAALCWGKRIGGRKAAA